MRHTFASRLVMAGVDLRTVQELMGHKTIAMTPSSSTELIGEFESPTGNLQGTLPDASDDSLPSKVVELMVFYGLPLRAGDRGRTGDVQLGKLAFYH